MKKKDSVRDIFNVINNDRGTMRNWGIEFSKRFHQQLIIKLFLLIKMCFALLIGVNKKFLWLTFARTASPFWWLSGLRCLRCCLVSGSGLCRWRERFDRSRLLRELSWLLSKFNIKFTFWHKIIFVLINFLSIILSSSTTISLFIVIRSNEKTVCVQLNTKSTFLPNMEKSSNGSCRSRNEKNIHYNITRRIDFFHPFLVLFSAFLPYFVGTISNWRITFIMKRK